MGEGFAFFRWMIYWGYAYKSKLTNDAALNCSERRKLKEHLG